MMLPPEALKNHSAIIGKAGSGKTYTAKGFVEDLLDRKERVCIIDPTGVWWGLKSSTNGKRAGYPIVIFGGTHGNLPIDGSHGETIAEIVGTSTTPVIVDTSQMRTKDRVKFFTDFAEGLLRLNRGPLHLIIDEAHIFAPQGKVSDPQSGAMLHAANNLISLGRARGLRVTMITQRPAKLHKDSLTQVETLIMMRLIAPQDRKAAEEWIKDQADPEEGKKIIASLPGLKTGNGYIWSPELNILKQVTFPKIKTFDSSATPEAGEKQDVKMAPIDIDKISDRLKIVVEKVAANDPEKLKRRIAELEKKLVTPQQPLIASTKKIKAAEHRGWLKGYEVGHENGKCDGLNEGEKMLAQSISKFLKDHTDNPRKLVAKESPFKSIEHMFKDSPTKFKIGAITAKNEIPKDFIPKTDRLSPRIGIQPSDELSGPQKKIIRSLQFWISVGQGSPSKAQVAMVAGYSPNGSAFTNPLGALRAAGVIVYPSPGHVGLVCGESGDMTKAEAKEAIMSVLDGPKRKIIGAWLQHEKAVIEMSREEVAKRSDYSAAGSAFTNPVGALCTLGILEKSGPGMLRLANWAGEIL